jgi:hypothetical protein
VAALPTDAAEPELATAAKTSERRIEPEVGFEPTAC